MTLRRRLAAVLLAVVLGPLLLGAVAVGVTATRLAEERATERLGAAATVVSTAVTTVCQRARSAAESLAAAATGGERPVAAANLVVARRLAETARIENTVGATLGAAGDLSVPVPQWGDCTRGTPPKNGSRAVIAASVGIHRADGSLAGWARAAFTITAADLDTLVAVPDVGVTAVVGALPGVTNEDLPGVTNEDLPGVSKEKEKETDVRSATLRMRILEPIPGRPVRTILRTPAPDTTALYGTLSVVVLTAAGAALIAANLLAKALTTPLAEVAAAARQVAEGDLAARAPVRVLDEVGQLAATFNRTTRSMQAYIAALTAGRDQLRGTLALLGDTMSSTNDVDRILEVVLESVVATTAAESGVVLLTDGPDLVGRRALGRSDDVRIPIGEGLLGEVAATGEARQGRENCRTFIVVPIVGPAHPPAIPEGRLLGVLALYDRLGGDDFDDGDLLTVRSFAGQVAVALENALLHRAVDPLRPHRALRTVSRTLRATPAADGDAPRFVG